MLKRSSTFVPYLIPNTEGVDQLAIGKELSISGSFFLSLSFTFARCSDTATFSFTQHTVFRSIFYLSFCPFLSLSNTCIRSLSLSFSNACKRSLSLSHQIFISPTHFLSFFHGYSLLSIFLNVAFHLKLFTYSSLFTSFLPLSISFPNTSTLSLSFLLSFSFSLSLSLSLSCDT